MQEPTDLKATDLKAKQQDDRPIFTLARPMVAFDLETTGLDPALCRVTCACLYGDTEQAPVRQTFLFKGVDQAEDLRLREEFMAALDAAPYLCAFNGVRFDIPFMQQAWGVEPDRAAAWVRKTFDVFEACKLAFSRTFGLDRLLEMNGLEGKSGSGKHAIVMAAEGKWEALGDYCMQDTRMTHIVSALQSIELPLLMPWGQRVFLEKSCPSLFVLRAAVNKSP